MKLIWIEIEGYKRFGSKTKLNTQGKVISLIGPNEAGKSSLIDAIHHIGKEEAIKTSGPNKELTRGIETSNSHFILNAGFLLEENDRNSISHIKGGKNVRWFIKWKKADGNFLYDIIPPIVKEYKLRKEDGAS